MKIGGSFADAVFTQSNSHSDEANMAAIYVTECDMEALARLAYAEAENIARATGDLKAAYGSVAEAVLNRTMSGQGYLGRDGFATSIYPE